MSVRCALIVAVTHRSAGRLGVVDAPAFTRMGLCARIHGEVRIAPGSTYERAMPSRDRWVVRDPGSAGQQTNHHARPTGTWHAYGAAPSLSRERATPSSTTLLTAVGASMVAGSALRSSILPAPCRVP